MQEHYNASLKKFSDRKSYFKMYRYVEAKTEKSGLQALVNSFIIQNHDH
jgi:hypothetical protein